MGPLALGDEGGADPVAQRACYSAWRGVLTTSKAPPRHARTTRRGRPNEEINPRAPCTALTSTPLFTERYNDWWDSEKRPVGRPVRMGARQPCLHQGEPWGRAFKLSWKKR